LRCSGIEIIGDVPWGTHFCQFYETGLDLIETLVPYFREGLAGNEFCMWITSAPLDVEEAKAAIRTGLPDADRCLREGRIEILDYSQWYIRSGKFSAEEVLRGWVEKLEAAREKGFEGLRLSGNTFWLEADDWDDFTRYEETINNVIGRYPMMALCTYSLKQCGASEIMDVVANHQFALIKRKGRWEIIESFRHKQMEDALRASEERYRGLVEMSPDAVFVNRDNRIVFVNPEAVRLLGASDPEEVLGKSPYELFHPEYHPTLDERIRRLREGKAVPLIEARIVQLDGALRNVEVAASPFEDREGSAIQVILRDITGRKEAEEELRESEARWRLLAASMPNLVWTCTPDGECDYLSPQWVEYTGVPEAEQLGFDWLERVHPEDRDSLMAAWNGAVASEQAFDVQFRIRRRDGVYRWFQTRAVPVRDRKGRIVKWYGSNTDIEDLKQAEEALRKSEHRYRNLFETMNEGFALHEVVCDEDGRPCDYRFLEINPGFEAQTGLRSSDLVGRTVREVLPDTEPFWIERYGRVALTGEFDHFEHYSGSLGRHYEVRAFQTEPGHFAVLFYDITDRKRAEEALRASEARYRLLSDTANRLLGSDDPQGIVQELCREVMEHLDCQAFFNFLVDPEVGRLHLNACAGIPEEEARKIEWLDYGVAVCGCVAQGLKPIVVEDIACTPDPRTELVQSYGIQAYACHPLIAQGRLLGTLSFGTRTRSRFSDEDLALMRTVTDQVAIAMERIQLIDQLRKSRDVLEERVKERTVELERANEALRCLSSRLLFAHEAERKRVAGEIHDTIGACLSAVKFVTEGALQRMEKSGDGRVGPLKTVIPVIQESIEECRRIQMDLRPTILDDLGLLATFSWFCRRFQTIYSGIRIEQRFDIAEHEIPDSLKIVVYRVTQEAMNNIVKHSGAEQVRLSFRKKDGRINLLIRDNGRGFDLEKALSTNSTDRGWGLLNMRERTELSGGTFDITAAEGKGTTIRASWPLPGANPEEQP